MPRERLVINIVAIKPIKPYSYAFYVHFTSAFIIHLYILIISNIQTEVWARKWFQVFFRPRVKVSMYVYFSMDFSWSCFFFFKLNKPRMEIKLWNNNNIYLRVFELKWKCDRLIRVWAAGISGVGSSVWGVVRETPPANWGLWRTMSRQPSSQNLLAKRARGLQFIHRITFKKNRLKKI